MAENSTFFKVLLSLIVFIGLVPLFYFVSVEIGIAEAAVSLTGEKPDLIETPQVDPLDRYIENLAFGVGERLEFDINYGFINAGTATLSVLNLVEFNNRPCYQIESRAMTNSFFSTFYKVDDRIESIMDAVGLFSWHFEKILREGNYKSDRKYTFNQQTHSVVYENDTIIIPPFVQDAISTLYYTRTQDLKVGESIFLDNFIDGKNYRLEVRVLGRETINVEAGTFDCIVVEPLTADVGVFKHEGQLKVWLTDDYLKMPVLMKSKVLVGSFSAELTDFRLGEIRDF